MVAGPIDDRAVVGIAADVAGEVSHVHHARRGIVDINVAHVVHGAIGRDVIHAEGPGVAHAPGSIRAIRDVPHPLIARVVAPIREDDLGVGVDRVLQIGALDDLELRGPVVTHLEAVIVALDRARLRDLGVRDGVLCLIRARDARENVPLGRVGRHVPKARGQLVTAYVRPGPVLRDSPVPSAGEQHVESLRADLADHVALRIRYIEQLVVDQRRVTRRPVRRDQLRGFGRGEHERRRPHGLVVVGGIGRHDRAYRGGRTGNAGPGAQRVLRGIPEGSSVQVVVPVLRVEDHRVGRIHDALKVPFRNRLDRGRSVIDDQDGSLGGEHDARRSGVETRDARALLLGGGETRPQFFERSRQVPLGGLSLHQALVAARLVGRDAGQPHLGDVEIARRHGARVTIDRDLLGKPEHPERRIRVAALLQGKRGASGEHVPLQVLGLRLVDHERAARGIELTRPAGVACPRGGGQRERGDPCDRKDRPKRFGSCSCPAPSRRQHGASTCGSGSGRVSFPPTSYTFPGLWPSSTIPGS